MSNGQQAKTHKMQVVVELSENNSEGAGEKKSRELGWDSNCL